MNKKAHLRINKEEWKPNLQQYSMQVCVDDATLLRAKVVEDASKFYHAFDKGCIFEEQHVYYKKAKKWIKVQFCITHKADCCRCGWEIHHHYNTHSLMMGVINYNKQKE